MLMLRFAVLGMSLAWSAVCAQPPSPHEPPLEWRALEARVLRHQVQLTFPDRFARAGEAYFSPDGEWIIFQAIERPLPGAEAEPFYAMFVAKLTREGGRVTGLERTTRVSPAESANTCGWFDPRNPARVIFGTTSVRPADEQKSGFQVGTRRYKWMFPEEMDIVTADVFGVVGAERKVRESVPAPRALLLRPQYDAECSFDSTGRFLLYAHVEGEPQMGKADANIYVYDTVTKEDRVLVSAPGYDGGPFFSPDDKRICFRSDRRGDDLLQIFVADLKWEAGADGVPAPVGVEREHQLTDNGHVNWAPYWHPSGEFLVYAGSGVAHTNYEVFAIQVPRKPEGEERPPSARVTQASGADVLPAFSVDGRLMMWTSQRAGAAPGEERASSQLWIAEWVASPLPEVEASR